MSDSNKKWYSLNLNRSTKSTSCGCGKESGSCDSEKPKDGYDQIMEYLWEEELRLKKLLLDY